MRRAGRVDFHDATTLEFLKSISLNSRKSEELIFGPDSKSIYSDYGHYLFRRSYVTGKKVWSGKVEHSSLWVRSIALSKDGSLLAAGRNGGRVDLYETDDASGEASHQFQGSLRNRWLEFSPDASILAIPQGTPAHKVCLLYTSPSPRD